MTNLELKQKYDKLVAEIESAEVYDGRGKGIDVYVCEKCGKQLYTRYKDKGVTPFTIKCRYCENGTMEHDSTISEQGANIMGYEVHNWVRPTFEQLLQLSEGAQEHVLNGGLMLEDELENNKSIVQKKFEKIQETLESLQREKASFLFIGKVGKENYFTLGGNPIELSVQILFAMCRYPVVRFIIEICAKHFNKFNLVEGDDIRGVKMDHYVEQNLGNDNAN